MNSTTKKSIDWWQFMLESNGIEGENRTNPDDEDAFYFALDGINTAEDVLALHRILGKHLKKDWVGKWRTCQVKVGLWYVAPDWQCIPQLMENFVEKLPSYNSWTAHNEFEKIHPFRDLNGRVGRLIWLSKVVDEGYNFKIPFLQQYYYQTLRYYHG